MEERVFPVDGNKDDPPLKPVSGDKVPPPPGMALVKSNETYVIRIPRDQIYRVPPPENAEIVESYRKPSGNNGKRGCGGRCWIFAVLVALLVIGFGIFLAIQHFSNPKSPKFSIAHFGRKATKLPSHHHTPLHNKNAVYEILLQVFNPNEKSVVHYGSGNLTLHFKRYGIAYGVSKLVEQGGGTTVKVDHSLHGTKVELPEEIQKIMNDKHPRVLVLKIDVPIEVKSWDKTFKKMMVVGCELEVDSLTHQSAKILSQQCGTN
ncbi:OLC1v1009229C1 [Oldenlandia corymbosa var. corymbosa]|uniref:OLC1v1009229C1 n=1 Tax=Oldenlandia corymbosa var. corymbosa TaxID=529605 RepID=A0AAV1DQU3_OLDCO|nr:OLC1v1009229C1 [Oldenlandia corymbosa var. corymbosa]